jgi:hypothetical protein
MAKVGRPKKEFDLNEVRKLGTIGASQSEMAAWFECSRETVNDRMNNDENFHNAYYSGWEKCNVGLKRTAVDLALKGNPNMLRFLLITRCGMKEGLNVNHSFDLAGIDWNAIPDTDLAAAANGDVVVLEKYRRTK